jgi:hypothetical protein
MLMGDWPTQSGLIPAGTILGDDAIPPPTVPLPINALSLDTAAAEQMCHWYEETNSIAGWHALHFHPSVNREKGAGRGAAQEAMAEWSAIADHEWTRTISSCRGEGGEASAAEPSPVIQGAEETCHRATGCLTRPGSGLAPTTSSASPLLKSR